VYNSYSTSWSTSYGNSWGLINDVVPEPSTGGGGRILKPDYYAKPLVFGSIQSDFHVDIKPNKVDESSYSYKQEINRFQLAIDSLNIQVEATKLEIEIHNDLIRKVSIERDIILVRNYIKYLIEQINVLSLIMRKRKQEEELLLILISY